MDVIALHQAGFDNAVAPLGTALTDNQVRIMSKYVPEVLIATDADEAGQKAARRSFGLLDAAGVSSRIIKIVGAKDPDEYIKTYGKQRFAQLLSSSVSAIENEISAILKKYDIVTDSGKVSALKEVSRILATTSNAIERDVYISRLANTLNVSREAISQNVQALIRQNKNAQAKKERQSLTVQNGLRDNVNPQKRKLLSAAVCEEWLLGSLFGNPDFLKILDKHTVTRDDFVTDWGKKMFDVILPIARESETLDLLSLGSQITPDEMARLAATIAREGNYVRTSEQFEEVIFSLRAERNKAMLSGENIKSMDDESLRDLIEKLGEDKK